MNIPTVPSALSPFESTTGGAVWWLQAKVNDFDFGQLSNIPNANYGEDVIPLFKNSNFSYRHVFDPGVDHMELGYTLSPFGINGSPHFFSCNKNKPWSLFGPSYLGPNIYDPEVPGFGGSYIDSTFFTGLMLPTMRIQTATVKQARTPVPGPLVTPRPSYDRGNTYIQDINGNYFYSGPDPGLVPGNRDYKYFEIRSLNTDIKLVNSPTPAPSGYLQVFRQIAVPVEDNWGSYPYQLGSAVDVPQVSDAGYKFDSYQNVRISDPGPFGDPQQVIADLYYESVANQFEVGDRVYIITHQVLVGFLDGFSLNSDGTYTPLFGTPPDPDNPYLNTLIPTEVTPDMKRMTVLGGGAKHQFYFNGNNFHDFEIIWKTIGSDRKVGSECTVNTTAPYVAGFGYEYTTERSLLETLGYGPDGLAPGYDGYVPTESDVAFYRELYSQLQMRDLSSPSVSFKTKRPSSTKSSFCVPTTSIRVEQGDSSGIDTGLLDATIIAKRFKLKEFEIYGGSTSIGGWKVGNI